MKSFIIYLICTFAATKAFCQNVTYVLANDEKIQNTVIDILYKKRATKYDKDSFTTYLQTGFQSYFNNPAVKAAEDKNRLVENWNELLKTKDNLEQTKKELETHNNNKTSNKSHSELLSKNTKLKTDKDNIDKDVKARTDQISADIDSLRKERDTLIVELKSIDTTIDLTQPIETIMNAAKKKDKELDNSIGQAKKTSDQKENVTNQIKKFEVNVTNYANQMKSKSFEELLNEEYSQKIKQYETNLESHKALMKACGKENTYNDLKGKIANMSKYTELAKCVKNAKDVLQEKYSKDNNEGIHKRLSDSAKDISLNGNQQQEIQEVIKALVNRDKAIQNSKDIAQEIMNTWGCIPTDEEKNQVLEFVKKRNQDFGKYNFLYNDFMKKLKDRITNYKTSKWYDENKVQNDLEEMLKLL